MRSYVVIDTETDPIDFRQPHVAPAPLGVGILRPRGAGDYLNLNRRYPATTKAEVRRRLRAEIADARQVVFHNAPFDRAVLRQHLGITVPSAKVADTIVGAFLHWPDSRLLGLKDIVYTQLGWPAEARDRLKDWLCDHVKVKGIRQSKTKFMEHLRVAPPTLVGEYCLMDCKMTEALWQKVTPGIQGPLATPYAREMRVRELFSAMTDVGVPIDAERLATDAQGLEKALSGRVEPWIRRRLGLPRGADLDVEDVVPDAMEDKGMLEEWIVTAKTEKRSMALYALNEVVLDRQFLEVWIYRSHALHALRNVATPWLQRVSDAGRIHCSWNSLAHGDASGRKVGARTGRASSSPNLQNLRGEGDTPPVRGWPAVPNVRDYVRAPRGEALVDADYAQQELRILAVYERWAVEQLNADQGPGPWGRRRRRHQVRPALYEAYQRDPTIDVHVMVQGGFGELGFDVPRRRVKTLNFGGIYGQGLDLLAFLMRCSRAEASSLRRIHRKLLPAAGVVDQALRAVAKRGEPIWTLGGRSYHCEPPRVVDGELRSFEYKLINTAIQGTAADMLKDAMIAYADHPKREGEMLLNVHDECLTMPPWKARSHERQVLVEAMESVEYDLPMLAEASMGKTWAEAK